jgi:hypothetical protein
MDQKESLVRKINNTSVDSEDDVEQLFSNAPNESNTMREKLSNVWLLQAKLQESLGNLCLKIPPHLRSSAEFNNVSYLGNELKVRPSI